MIESEREKLFNRDSAYLSIGITEGGINRSMIGVPWKMTAHAYTMRTPDVYISAEDLNDEAVMEKILEYKVVGCYIFTPLRDYGFLNRFKEIEDISIRCAENLKNLDFLKGLARCSMLFLQNAKLQNLDMLFDIKEYSQSILGGFTCVGLYNCEIEDLSRFEREEYRFSEFLIWNPKSRNERERFKVVWARKFVYHEYDEH